MRTLTQKQAFPPLGLNTLGRAVAMGAAGLVVWEIFARLIAPSWIGFALDPTALIEMATGIAGFPSQILHILTGLVFFPLGYVFVAQPVARSVLPALPWAALGLLYGVGLWVFALYFMASLLGGAPPFLGFEPIAWASLVGHLGLGLAIAAVAAFLPGDQS